MNVPLKKHHADWIAEQISAGRYATELEAIEDAITAKIDNDEIARLQEKLRRSDEDIAAGRVVLADDAFWQRLHDRIDAIEAAKRGRRS